ncbi:unnamed protein product [Cyprideis torosa]|uniref:Uncharacterized protein n=1 Tax=Cyprideis torosa TaxID=163714 RepID=A0A7R8W7J7_9CRUS|nr:unnamed protein product [Cyprideis torosa]CAG0885253.1 unnamed protein product [Cyprideis torosa]
MKAVLALLMLVVFVAAEPGPPTTQEVCEFINNHEGMRNCDNLPENVKELHRQKTDADEAGAADAQHTNNLTTTTLRPRKQRKRKMQMDTAFKLELPRKEKLRIVKAPVAPTGFCFPTVLVIGILFESSMTEYHHEQNKSESEYLFPKAAVKKLT